MKDIIQSIEKSDEFVMVWRIPFEKNKPLSMKYVIGYVDTILHGDCWIAGTFHKTFFNLHNPEYDKEDKKRTNMIFQSDILLFEQEKIYIIMGHKPFRYITIEYMENGIGVITDYQHTNDI